MAKVVKKKRKKIRLVQFTAFVFFASVMAFLASSLFLRTYNNSLSSKKQEIEMQIAQLQVDNDAVRVDISTLSARDRVNNIASENGLRMEQDNIITITTSDGE